MKTARKGDCTRSKGNRWENEENQAVSGRCIKNEGKRRTDSYILSLVYFICAPFLITIYFIRIFLSDNLHCIFSGKEKLLLNTKLTSPQEATLGSAA